MTLSCALHACSGDDAGSQEHAASSRESNGSSKAGGSDAMVDGDSPSANSETSGSSGAPESGVGEFAPEEESPYRFGTPKPAVELSTAGTYPNQIDAPNEFGAIDIDRYMMLVPAGNIGHAVVEARDLLQPYLESAQPVGSRVGYALGCDFGTCQFPLHVGDVRDQQEPLQGVGGIGFEYTLTLSYFPVEWQPMTLPHAGQVSLDDVGDALRYQVNVAADSVLLCEANEPTGQLDVGCAIGVSGGFVSSALILPADLEDIPLVVRDYYHRGAPELPVDLALTTVPIPENFATIAEADLSGPVTPNVMVSGPATGNELIEIPIEIRLELRDAAAAPEPDDEEIAELQALLQAAEAEAEACASDCAGEYDVLVAQCASSCLPCSYDPEVWCIGGQLTYLDGTPLFFPVDGVDGPTADLSEARVPEAYGSPGYSWEGDVTGEFTQHNFSFTTEARLPFVYTDEMNALVEILGDDDIWLFINGTLAIDIGGLHPPLEGSIAINSSTAASFGLQHGQSYEIALFHAERQLEGSSFRLSLTGFNLDASAQTSVCAPR